MEIEVTTACGDCGMAVRPREYHPYAACLMFKACHDGTTVRANLRAVLEHAREGGTMSLERTATHD